MPPTPEPLARTLARGFAPPGIYPRAPWSPGAKEPPEYVV